MDGRSLACQHIPTELFRLKQWKPGGNGFFSQAVKVPLNATWFHYCVKVVESLPMLAHSDIGTGPPIVFLHGWSLEGSTWRPQADRLVDLGHRVIVPDLPGHGRSLTLPADRSFPAMPDAVLELLSTLHVDQAVVVGLSMGSAIAVELALTAPETVAGLVLADNAASDGDATRATTVATRLRSTTHDKLATWYAPLMFSETFRRENPAAVAAWALQFGHNDLDALAEVILSYHVRRDVRPLLAGITVPTMVVFGSEDATTPEERRRDYEAVPGAERRDLPGAGHLSNVEQPEQFTRLVQELTSRVPGFAPTRRSS